ncbi:hypothetical protein B0I35DRAFT_515063 [Stachybotrys elegans]|uniref:T6SS Phospholipase effector Tle1-like catalytic domain-containing protein n=1 Tax=Stachybotrys elegans TaxID=80388 RepID=A0A8K0SMF2_9HYPO|nr:hypothetical protein B0I35DRAFT_515063 [Stachybotrys elegans]
MAAPKPQGKLAKGAVRCAHLQGYLEGSREKGHPRPRPNSKRLIICCDGTWNNTNDSSNPASNVSRLSGAFARSCCSGMPQVIYYHPGAGTETSWVAQVLGGTFGYGVPQDIAESYRFICNNYRNGDELFLIGFSRGAFTARSIAGMVCSLGFLNRAGIDQLPHIFKDYTNWLSWTDVSQFDEKVHLLGFNLENMEKNEKVNVFWEGIRAKWKSTQVSREPSNVSNGKQTPARDQSGDPFSSTASLLPETHDVLYTPRSREMLQAELETDKRELFGEIVRINGMGKRARTKEQVAKKYRDLLWKHQMVMTTKAQSESSSPHHGDPILNQNDAEGPRVDRSQTLQASSTSSSLREGREGEDHEVHEWEKIPIEGKVRAIGIWDTVGSLGIPKSPLSGTTRRAREIQFESLYVHPKVEHAFHAIALDEWRSAFPPTMWGLGDNTKTKLRQVWFPGSHANVGGGWNDQQIATIALAWMADQLTPLGVEFSRQEMERIFSSVNHGVEVREWAMGRICNPTGLTTYTDKVYNGILWPYNKFIAGNTDYTPRTPGRYNAEDPPKRLLEGTSELVHPSVRIRYLYSGPGLDDNGAWGCNSLTGKHGYVLCCDSDVRSRPGPEQNERGSGYQCVFGAVIPYYGNPPKDRRMNEDRRLVRVEQPNWFKTSFNKAMEQLLPRAEQEHRWYWSPKDDNRVALEEEHIGIWEQKFIYINDRLLKEQAKLEGQNIGLGESTLRYKLREGVELPRGYPSKYGLYDVRKWENWDTAE